MSLKNYLEECKAAYYGGKPIISDSQYDALEDVCSEDLTVGTNKGRSKHLYRMYSLRKFYVGEDVLPEGHKELYIETPKLDGAAASILYLKGELYSIITRGNGEYGENITHLFDRVVNEYNNNEIKWLKGGIPDRILNYKGPLQITGEFVSPKHINNSRNYAAGALNLKDSDEFHKRDITFVAYDMQPYTLEYYQDTTGVLNDYVGFHIVSDSSITDKYPQDGKVFRLDSNKEYQEEGYTSKHPRGAFALKERTEGVLTTLLRVDWETGKSGKVTPVAILDTVDIDGAKVSRATLNNPGFIKALDLHIGDAVMVERAGGIIPRIIKKAESEDIERAAKK